MIIPIISVITDLNQTVISLLPLISKIFEKLIYNRLVAYLEKNNILYKYQFGFRSKHSTELALTFLIKHISEAFENKQYVLSIFLDFSKAFDTVNFQILLNKLQHYGIRGIPLKWFKSYLINRKHVIHKNKFLQIKLL